MSLAVLCLGAAAGWLFAARAWRPPAGSDRSWTWRQVGRRRPAAAPRQRPGPAELPAAGIATGVHADVADPGRGGAAGAEPAPHPAEDRGRRSRGSLPGWRGTVPRSVGLGAGRDRRRRRAGCPRGRLAGPPTATSSSSATFRGPRCRPLPRGAYAVQDFLFDWSAADAVRYYTGRRVTFRIHSADGAEPCRPADGDADHAVRRAGGPRWMTTSSPRTSPTDVTVVIPTVGRPLLRDCLRSIAAGDTWPAELIVVDQSSSAGGGGLGGRAPYAGTGRAAPPVDRDRHRQRHQPGLEAGPDTVRRGDARRLPGARRSGWRP